MKRPQHRDRTHLKLRNLSPVGPAGFAPPIRAACPRERMVFIATMKPSKQLVGVGAVSSMSAAALLSGRLAAELPASTMLGSAGAGANGVAGMSLRTKNILSGTLGGLTMISLFHPLDTVKTRFARGPNPPCVPSQQALRAAQPRGVRRVQCQAMVLAADQPRIYSGAIDCFRQTLRAEGVRGLYKGLASPMAGQVLYNAALFTVYDEVRAWQAQRAGGAPAGGAAAFAAGALTGLAVTAAEHPFDLVKCKMQLEGLTQQAAARRGAAGSGAARPAAYRSAIDCFVRISREHGAAGWAQGASATLARNVSACFWFFGLFEAARRALDTCRPDAPRANLALAGGAAGGASAALSLPLDVARSSLMAEPSDPAARRLRGLRDCARQLYAAAGPRAFAAGLAPGVARSAAGSAVLVVVVDAARKALSP
jgi:solute carrier family 25 carnitine/acylcarnitine transporter 20/29